VSLFPYTALVTFGPTQYVSECPPLLRNFYRADQTHGWYSAFVVPWNTSAANDEPKPQDTLR